MIKFITDLLTKVGGVLGTIGMLLGGVLWYPDCETRGFGGKACSNITGDVALDRFGNPSTVELVAVGCLIGAVVGLLVGYAITSIWPNTKSSLF